MRPLFGEVAAILIIAPFIALLVGILDLRYTLFLSVILFALWTLISGLALVDSRQKIYYISWGLLVASLSTGLIAPPQYAAALILASVIIIILYAALSRNQKREETKKTVTLGDKSA